MSRTKAQLFWIRCKRYIPLCLPLSLAAALITFVLHMTAISNASFADAVNYYWGGALRFLAAKITGLVPFSIAEGLLLFSPVLVIVLFSLSLILSKRSIRTGVRYICTLLSIIFLLYTLFVPMLGIGSYASPLSDRLGLTESKVTALQLAETMKWVIDEVNQLDDEVDFRFGGASVMPFQSFDEMCEDLMIGYDRLGEEYPLFFDFSSVVKPVILSEPMSYTHITGIYTFFTGEANLNVNFPDYTLPFTAAHELAHQRGIAREKEANFVAFLVCINSDNPYTRYSGYLNMVEYLSGALYSADKALWEKIYRELDNCIVYELYAYDEFYEKYRENTAATISNAVNDTYLKVQGQTAGTKSYGLVVDLAVAYYEKNFPRT